MLSRGNGTRGATGTGRGWSDGDEGRAAWPGWPAEVKKTWPCREFLGSRPHQKGLRRLWRREALQQTRTSLRLLRLLLRKQMRQEAKEGVRGSDIAMCRSLERPQRTRTGMDGREACSAGRRRCVEMWGAGERGPGSVENPAEPLAPPRLPEHLPLRVRASASSAVK